MLRIARSIPFLLVLLGAALAPAADLRLVETRHYHLHTDLDPLLARDLADRLDRMYDEYAHRLTAFGSPQDAGKPLEVYLFRKQRDYNAFTANRMKNSGGVFLPSQNLLAAFLQGQGRDTLRRTLQHEAFHQFAYNSISTELPIWLNEGLAQLFEEGLWNGDGLVLGEVPPRRVRQLTADLKSHRLVPFDTLLRMTPETWAERLARNPNDGTTQYNQSWAMVHFLVMSRDEHGNYRYRARVIELLHGLRGGKSADEAFKLAFGTNVRGFQDRFDEYAGGLKPTPEATLIENQGVLADLLIDFAREGRRFDDMEDFRHFVTAGHYRLHYARGNLEWDTDRNMNRYFADLSGRMYGGKELYFHTISTSALPELVCRCTPTLTMRTRFYRTDEGPVEHELNIEPVVAGQISRSDE